MHHTKTIHSPSLTDAVSKSKNQHHCSILLKAWLMLW